MADKAARLEPAGALRPAAELRPFALERYFAAYEFAVDFLLSASDCEALSLSALVEGADAETRGLWEHLSLAYTESQGHPLLRAEIAKLYETIDPGEVLTAVPEEAIFLLMHALLRPGDHVVAMFPAYQSLYALAEGLGCRVTRWPLRAESGKWVLDMDALAESLTDDTRLIVINFPHNPTGFLPPREQFEAIIGMARERGIYVFSDEMYRLLEYSPDDTLPAGCDLYERAVSLSGLSKTFSLPGLRLGWLATHDRALLAACGAFKDYTTICGSAPSEILGIMGLRERDQIIATNRALIAENVNAVNALLARHRDRLAWRPPQAGSVAVGQLLAGGPIEDFCRGLLAQENTMLLPGSVFEMAGDCFRLGLGRRNFKEGLARLERYLEGVIPG
jgi:aspartate/methionine/tyrosine aminotransferase